MASDNTSPQPGTETNQNSEQEEKKAGGEEGMEKKQEAKKTEDEIETAIQKISELVKNLQDKIPKTDKKMMNRSTTVPATSTTQTPETTIVKSKSDVTGMELGEAESDTSIRKLQRNLGLLKDDVRKLKELNEEVAEELSSQCTPLDNLVNQVAQNLKYQETQGAEKGLTRGNKKELENINKKIFNLMCQVPLLPNKRRKAKGLDVEDDEKENHGKLIECLPAIHANDEDLKRLAVFKDVVAKFKALDSFEKKIYLLSFAVFPENQKVNRTMLMYWWIGEGILKYQVTPPKKGSFLAEKDRPENVVMDILDEFANLKLIEPVVNRRKVEPNSYKMTPFVHASVVRISMEMELFEIYQKGEKPTMAISQMNKVCLVEGSSSQDLAKANKMTRADQIETVFNVSERFPDFTFKWFSEDQSSANKKFRPLSKTTFKGLKVFYLGRWERTAKRHIEVENPELMKYLKHMTKLRLLSFQGISRIERLDDAVCKLRDLIILDLRACYNLEKLPDKIDSLKALTYLDITDCYMIDRMPKRLSWLDNLEVLKGFVVSDATDEETVCTLDELKHLEKLRKLSIAINKQVTVDKLFTDVQDFPSLEKLKLAWGGINKHTKEATPSAFIEFVRQATRIRNPQDPQDPQDPQPPKEKKKPIEIKPSKEKKPIEIPEKLKKLDLQCFPDEELPKYLRPDVLVKLEKLYIKGGIKLTGFGRPRPEEPTSCGVKILRLKFLPRLKVEWMELNELYFPKLEFLDKYQCPQVSFCPTDGMGIWRKEECKSKQL